MKKMINLISLLSLLCLTACGGNDNLSQSEPEADIPSSRAIATSGYKLPIDFQTDIDFNKIFRISTQKEFDKIFEEYPGTHEVDFSKYHLLLVKGQSLSGIIKIENKFTEYTDRYQLSIDVYHNIASVAPVWYVALLVPHVPVDAEIGLEVNMLYVEV